MMNIALMIRYSLFILVFVLTTPIQADTINSATIIKNTLIGLPNCLHYQLSGHFCIWINEQGDLNTTPIVNHYLPDLVVSVFNRPQADPWLEINKTLDTIGNPIQQVIVHSLTGLNAGSGNHSFQDEHDQSVIFKEVDILGNPALAIIPVHGLLPSAVTPLIPYYQSMADSMLWRGIPPLAVPEESLAFSLNTTHHVGTGLTNWGGIYPHEGKVFSDNEIKASAVIASRAADLLTNHSELGHIYKTISTTCAQHCKAATIKENSKEVYFQMIYPIIQNECHILGDSQSYSSNMFSLSGSYVWVIWRHYEGCANGDGQYLGRT